MMKALWTALVALALFGLFAGLGALAWFECAPPTKTCASCHEIRGARDGWAHSVHTNVSCKACHGGTLSFGRSSLGRLPGLSAVVTLPAVLEKESP